MKQIQNQFTTARLKTKTKIRAERAKLTYGFPTLEDAVDFFLLYGISAYRNYKKSLQNKI